MLSIVNCLQWLMTLITQASEEELVQLKAKAEYDVDNLIELYHQVCSLFVLQAVAGHLNQPAFAHPRKVTLHWWMHLILEIDHKNSQCRRQLSTTLTSCPVVSGASLLDCVFEPHLLLQKSEGDYRLIGASAGLANCLNSIFWRGDLPAALCAIAV